jgi:ubiquinol-cytochrome c reductase subunit 7
MLSNLPLCFFRLRLFFLPSFIYSFLYWLFFACRHNASTMFRTPLFTLARRAASSTSASVSSSASTSGVPALDELPLLRRLLVSLSDKYKEACGYRKYGLKLDDLWIETETVQEALQRLPQAELDARVFRFKRAIDANFHNDYLPASQWTKPEDDTPYLLPVIQEVQDEAAEKLEFK